jgi:segregation and condensation protein B
MTEKKDSQHEDMQHTDNEEVSPRKRDEDAITMSEPDNSAVDEEAIGENPEGTAEANSDHSDIEYAAQFEAILFISNEPLPISFFVKHFGIDQTNVKIVLDSLVDEYEERDGGIKLVEISNGFQFGTNPKYAEHIRRVMGFRKKEPLSKGMLETLAIVAYKQPIVLAEIEELRGVSSRMMVANLMKKNLVKPVGRKDVPGRPLAYGTTDEFLRFFGLNKLSDLPKLSEIKEFSYESDEE